MYEIIPFVGLGDFRLGASITAYLREEFVFTPKEEDDCWDDYTHKDGMIILFTAGDIIESIGCYADCFLDGKLLIGMNIHDFFGHFKPDDIVHDRVVFHDEREQDVYDIDSMGMQIWVDGQEEIVTVYIYD